MNKKGVMMTYPNCKEVSERSFSSEAQLKRDFEPFLENVLSKELNSRNCDFVLFCISSSCSQLKIKDEQEDRLFLDMKS